MIAALEIFSLGMVVTAALTVWCCLLLAAAADREIERLSDNQPLMQLNPDLALNHENLLPTLKDTNHEK